MREQRFDMIKGVAIFLVIVGHVLTFCIRGIDNAFLFKIVGEVHMPLFFFVSGWFSYKSGFRSPDLLKRFRQLVIPGAICMTLFFFAFPHTGVTTPFPTRYIFVLATVGKMGYWFVFTLFGIMVCYWALTKILRNIKTEKGVNIVAGVATAVIFSASYASEVLWLDAFEISLIGLYFLPFIAGVFAHRNAVAFKKIYENQAVYFSSLVMGCGIFYVIVYYWEFPPFVGDNISILKGILHILLALVAMPLFTRWEKDAFSSDATLIQRGNAQLWAYLGRNSLTIYLLHYFFLFPLTPIRQLMIEMHVAIIPTLIVAVFVASVIIALVLLVSKILSPSPVLKELLTGTR